MTFSEPQVTVDMDDFASSSEQLPLITIITPCLNGQSYVLEALESVARQQYPRLEHIFLDASSTDNTLALVAQYPHVTVISEPDESSHHAMNKGLLLAHGEIIGFLNVDDVYPDGVFLEVARIFIEQPDIDIVTGHTIWFEDSDAAGRKALYERIHDNGQELKLAGVPPFNGCFFRRTVFERCGNFETKYNFTADTQFLLRCALAHLKVQWIASPTMLYRQHVRSRTFNPERRSLISIFWELFRMTAEFAERAGTSEARRFFLTWNTLVGIHLVARNLLLGRIPQAIRAATLLCYYNPLWPMRLASVLALRRGARKLFRRPETQTVAEIA